MVDCISNLLVFFLFTWWEPCVCLFLCICNLVVWCRAQWWRYL